MATGERSFTYVTAVTKLIGDAALWEQKPEFSEAMANNPIKIIALPDMISEVFAQLRATLAGTELGRTLQLFRAAGIRLLDGLNPQEHA